MCSRRLSLIVSADNRCRADLILSCCLIQQGYVQEDEGLPCPALLRYESSAVMSHQRVDNAF